MEFKIAEVINHPHEQVYLTYRDRLPELVAYMENVDEITVLERDDGAGGGPRMINRWRVSGGIPAAVRPFFSEKMMTYLDHAQWDDAANLVNWRMEIGVFPGAVECRGINYFQAGAREGTTEVRLTGELSVDLARIRAVPRFLRGLAPRVESFVLGRIRPNLTAVARAVARFLDEGGQAPQ